MIGKAGDNARPDLQERGFPNMTKGLILCILLLALLACGSPSPALDPPTPTPMATPTPTATTPQGMLNLRPLEAFDDEENVRRSCDDYYDAWTPGSRTELFGTHFTPDADFDTMFEVACRVFVDDWRSGTDEGRYDLCTGFYNSSVEPAWEQEISSFLKPDADPVTIVEFTCLGMAIAELDEEVHETCTEYYGSLSPALLEGLLLDPGLQPDADLDIVVGFMCLGEATGLAGEGRRGFIK